MRALGVLGFLLAVAALVLSGYMFRTMPQDKEEPATAKQLAALSARVDATGDVKNAVGHVVRKVDALETGQAGVKEEVGNLRDEIAALKKQVDGLAAKAPAEAAEPKEGVTEDRVRELFREETRAMFERMRGARGGRRGGGDNRTELQQQVGLDEAKSQQVAGILDKEREEIGNIWRTNAGGDRDKNSELMRAVQAKTNEEVAKALTAEELEKYKQWRQERENRGGRGRRDRGDRGQREEGGGEAQGEADAVF